MKAIYFILVVILIIALIVLIGSCATGKKAYKKDYKFLAGTWINEEYNSHPHQAKYLLYRDGTWDSYNKTSDTEKTETGHYIITDKWTDSEGNIWYKSHVWAGAIVEGRPVSYELDRISKSGKVWEFISLTGDYPTEMDESFFHYHIYYRQ